MFRLSGLYREAKHLVHLRGRRRSAPHCFAALTAIEEYQQTQEGRDDIHGRT